MNRPTSAVPSEIVALGARYASAAEETTRAILREDRSVAKAEEIAAISAEYADREVAAWRGHPAAPSGIACRAGCDACCHAPIAATIPEAVRIAALILAGWPDGAFDALRDRLGRRTEAHRGLGLGEIRRLGRPCPLLDETGGCSIHPIRPLTCRGWNSLDAGRCDALLADPDGGSEVPTDPVQRTIAGSIGAGVRTGLGGGGPGVRAGRAGVGPRADPRRSRLGRPLARGESAFAGAAMREVGPEVHAIGSVPTGRPGG